MIIVVPHDDSAECCGRNVSAKSSAPLPGILTGKQTGFVMNETQFKRFCRGAQSSGAVYGVVVADTPGSWHCATWDEILALHARVAEGSV
jgi:hypothetical protein